MKHGKRPKKRHKVEMYSKGLEPNDWLIVKDSPEDFHIVHRDQSRLLKFKRSEGNLIEYEERCKCIVKGECL